MKILEATKDAAGFHYVVEVDATRTVTFDFRPVPAGKVHDGAGAATWTEALWVAMHEREIKLQLKPPAPTKTNVPSMKGKAL